MIYLHEFNLQNTNSESSPCDQLSRRNSKIDGKCATIHFARTKFHAMNLLFDSPQRVLFSGAYWDRFLWFAKNLSVQIKKFRNIQFAQYSSLHHTFPRFLHVYQCVWLSVCVFVCGSVSVSVWLYGCVTRWVSVCGCVAVPVCLSFCVNVCICDSFW